MSSLETIAAVIVQASEDQNRYNRLGNYWRNKAPASSYAARHGDPGWDESVTKKKQALQKAWPTLATLLQEAAERSPRK